MWLPKEFTALPDIYHADPASRLGAGTFGLVIAGHQTLTGERVAIKCIQIRTDEEEDLIKRELDTLSILMEPGHKHVLPLWDHVWLSNGALGVFPRCDCTLRRYRMTNSDFLDWDMVRSLNLQICMGIDYCHSCAVQHGDLHPGNILLELSENMEPCVRIVDFGASAVLKDCGRRPFRGE